MAAGQQELSSAGTPSCKRSISSLLDPAAADDSTGDGEVADDSLLYNLEKKRRLTIEQVRSLEISFEIQNKLEPERKVQLAKELGLQPRQVAIWFQNRRARWKAKQLEREYNLLKQAYDSLFSEKERLQNEIASLNLKLRSNSELAIEECEQVVKREKTDEYAADRSILDLEWKPSTRKGDGRHSLSRCLEQPTEESDQECQESSSDAAASSSPNYVGSPGNYANTSLRSDQLQLQACNQNLGSSCSPCARPVHFEARVSDQKEEHMLQLAQPGVVASSAAPTHPPQRLGSHFQISSHHQHLHSLIAFKMEDNFQEESFSAAALFPLDEHSVWPWTSWD